MPAGNLDLLKNSESPLRRITESMLIMISQVTIEGIYIYVSSAHKTILGYEPKELLNTCLFDMIHQEDIDKVKNSFIRGLTTGSFCKTDFRYRCADGRYVYLETVGDIVSDEDGNISGAVFGTRDISVNKKLEKEIARLDQLRLVGEMAASIAHEIRNPMTTVRGFLQLLAGEEGSRDNKEYFGIMIEEIDAANSIISEFLSLAKDKKLNFAMQNLNTEIKAIYPLIAADAMKSDIRIMLALEEVPNLYIDAKEIRQLILNLVRNGMESMEPGGQLTIRTIHDEEQVILSIEDQGHGIAADVMEKLGTPFFTTKDLGTGLGLTICYSIAARNNAAIDVKSNRQGSIFSVIFKVNEEIHALPKHIEVQGIKKPGSVRCVS